MRAVLTSFGSTGDIEPFFALAKELQLHGHDPILALTPYFRSRAEQLGLAFAPIGPELSQEQLWTWPEEPFERLMAGFSQVFHDLYAICEQADVLICSASQPIGRTIHELARIPFVSIRMIHLPTSVADYGPEEHNEEAQIASLINPIRVEHGLQPLERPTTVDGFSSQLALFSMSRFIQPTDPKWPAHYHVTGSFFLPEEPPWTPDAALVDFLEAGEKPIVISLGSAPYMEREAMTNLLLRAIEIAGCRAIIQQGWSGLGQNSPMPPHVYSLSAVPYWWLFPRVSCVINHGGLGTMMRALLAGAPMICITQYMETFRSAKAARKLGAVGAIIWSQHLSAERLGKAITDTLTNERYAQAAVAAGQQIQEERGVQTARRLIEQLVMEHTR